MSSPNRESVPVRVLSSGTRGKVIEMPVPRRRREEPEKTSGEPTKPPFVPPIRSSRKTRLGVSVQGFLPEEWEDRWAEYRERWQIGVSDCVAWLVLDAIATNRVPPGREHLAQG